MELMVIDRQDFWFASTILHHDVKVTEAGSLWVALFLNRPMIDALNKAGISTRKAYDK